MITMASQITSFTIIYSTVIQAQIKENIRVTGLRAGNSPGPVNSPHKGPVTRKMFPFDDVIMSTQTLNCVNSLRPSDAYWDRVTRIYVSKVTHFCVSQLTLIRSDNGLAADRRQAIIWSNAGIVFTGPLRTSFSGILIESKFMHFRSRKCFWKFQLENGSHFVSTWMCLYNVSSVGIDTHVSYSDIKMMVGCWDRNPSNGHQKIYPITAMETYIVCLHS